MELPKIKKSVASKADAFAEREYESDGYEREWLSKGYYHGYLEGQQRMIKNVCKWLEENIPSSDLERRIYNCFSEEQKSNLIERFKKEMEE